jgi:hypothetical protein
MTHNRFERAFFHPIGQLTHTRCTHGTHEPDGALETVTRGKIIYYRQIYLNRPDPMAFMSVTVDASEWDQFRFLHYAC